MRIAIVALALALVGCDELGNPTPHPSATTSRTTESSIGRLVTEVRLVAPEDVNALVTELGSALDHADRTVPPGGTIVAVVVRPESRGPRPEYVHLVTDLVLPGGVAERHVWVARGSHARFVALFGSRGTPLEARTSTL